ncbi:Syntaxin-12, partial [Varanus komodoensis]
LGSGGAPHGVPRLDSGGSGGAAAAADGRREGVRGAQFRIRRDKPAARPRTPPPIRRGSHPAPAEERSEGGHPALTGRQVGGILPGSSIVDRPASSGPAGSSNGRGPWGLVERPAVFPGSTAVAASLAISSVANSVAMSYGPLEIYRPGGLPPRDFSAIIQTCSTNVQRLAQCTSQIKNLMSQLGTKQDSSKLQESLQQLQHTANQLAKETNEYLKELGSLPLPLSTSEQRQQKLQKERLMNDFSAALNNFQAVQRRVSEKEKEAVARARAGSRLSGDERRREEQLVSFDSNEEWNQMQSQEEDVAITEQDLELIKERETAIRQLEADILDVNQIFKDLAMMIHDQGDMIDSIEANVENAEVHVESANEQLQRAAYHQKKSRKKICILILSLAVASLILIIILWQALK